MLLLLICSYYYYSICLNEPWFFFSLSSFVECFIFNIWFDRRSFHHPHLFTLDPHLTCVTSHWSILTKQNSEVHQKQKRTQQSQILLKIANAECFIRITPYTTTLTFQQSEKMIRYRKYMSAITLVVISMAQRL